MHGILPKSPQAPNLAQSLKPPLNIEYKLDGIPQHPDRIRPTDYERYDFQTRTLPGLTACRRVAVRQQQEIQGYPA